MPSLNDREHADPTTSTAVSVRADLLRGLTMDDGLDRRRFLELMGAALAMAGANGCSVSPPREEIVPHVRAPEYEVPGKPRYYATAVTRNGYATGVLVESHMGRPTRLEGNPDHPASQGALDAISQASILSLYDPDRSQAISTGGQIRTWEEAVRRIGDTVGRHGDGRGLRILTGTVTSPSLAAELERLLARYPAAKWHQYSPVNQDEVYAGSFRGFGRVVETRYHFAAADVVVSLDSDFLEVGPGHIRYARDFAMRRHDPSAASRNSPRGMNRLYVLETGYTNTGAMADHRLPLVPSQILGAARYLAGAIGVVEKQAWGLSDKVRYWLDIAASDLQSQRSVVVAGPWQPAEVHALAHVINARLGHVGETVEYTEPVAVRPVNQVESLRELVDDARSGEVDLLVIAGGNPAYDAPADVPFAGAIRRVGLSLRLGLYEDETSRLCNWHIPAAHELESWSDARAYDGTATILQPLIAPLFEGKTIHELIAAILGEGTRSSHDVVRDFWKAQRGEEGFARFWHESLDRGTVGDSRYEPVEVAAREISVASPAIEVPPTDRNAFEVTLRPDATLDDGQFANNAWLQELPKPITKLTWGNAALVSPRTARQLGVVNEQWIEIQAGSRSLRMPAWLVPGHADGAISLSLGHGRREVGRVGRQVGVDVSPFRATDSFWSLQGVQVRPLGGHGSLACTQQHHQMEGRNLVRTATWSEYGDDPEFAADHDHGELSLYPHDKADHGDHDYAWGMSINLNSCTGCNACVVACQAENNIPTVGKEGVENGREMHWIRIDHYFLDEGDNPRSAHQPVTCMHCENAPCEVVCPVAATVHSAEGLNEMVYNRCVGTRYCSNNCPYKVRRFNFLKYNEEQPPIIQLLRNPDVTVRARGVMEKCTYCVQRISAARIDAKRENRSIRDGEIVTACQSACPTQAIVFGDTADPASRVAQQKKRSLNYGLLTELNTHPRTTYLARVTNPHPALEKT